MMGKVALYRFNSNYYPNLVQPTGSTKEWNEIEVL